MATESSLALASNHKRTHCTACAAPKSDFADISQQDVWQKEMTFKCIDGIRQRPG